MGLKFIAKLIKKSIFEEQAAKLYVFRIRRSDHKKNQGSKGSENHEKSIRHELKNQYKIEQPLSVNLMDLGANLDGFWDPKTNQKK